MTASLTGNAHMENNTFQKGVFLTKQEIYGFEVRYIGLSWDRYHWGCILCLNIPALHREICEWEESKVIRTYPWRQRSQPYSPGTKVWRITTLLYKHQIWFLYNCNVIWISTTEAGENIYIRLSTMSYLYGISVVQTNTGSALCKNRRRHNHDPWHGELEIHDNIWIHQTMFGICV